MSTPIMLTAMFALAAGTYAFRASGPALRNRIRFPERATKLLEVGAVILLAAMVAITTLPTGSGQLGFALPAGVVVGGLLAWRNHPMLVVILAAAATTALLRLVGVT